MKTLDKPPATPGAVTLKPADFHLVPVASLHEDPANVRRHPDRNREVVRASLREFGQVEALVVEKGTGRVIGGNCRLAVLRALGVEWVQVAEVDVHGVDATRLALVLNRSAEIAEWDDGLADLLRSLDEEGADLAGIGWSAEDMARLLDVPAPEPDGGADQEAIEGTYAVLVTCESERQQRELLEQLDAEGLKCRAWNL